MGEFFDLSKFRPQRAAKKAEEIDPSGPHSRLMIMVGDKRRRGNPEPIQSTGILRGTWDLQSSLDHHQNCNNHWGLTFYQVPGGTRGVVQSTLIWALDNLDDDNCAQLFGPYRGRSNPFMYEPKVCQASAQSHILRWGQVSCWWTKFLPQETKVVLKTPKHLAIPELSKLAATLTKKKIPLSISLTERSSASKRDMVKLMSSWLTILQL